jgi:hypothetical protein
MNHAPPSDIPATALWLALASSERPSKVVDFPRFNMKGEAVGQLRIRILTQEEQMVCASAAEKLTKEHLKEGKRDELGYERLFSDALCVEVLFRACRDEADVNRPAFPSAKQIRQALTTDEAATLFQHYLTVQLELGPTRIEMSDEEAEAWIDRVAEGGSSFPFDLLSSDLQRLLLLHMAFQLRSSPTDKSSAGSQPEEPTTETEAEPEPEPSE